MTVKIRIRDFQSIDDAEIEIRGLTVITGQNNTGKSAAIRAVQGVFTNARGHKFVRNGKSHCTVDVHFSDGQTVTWEKGDGVNRYTVNGKTLDKVGQSVPAEVEALGIAPITAAGRELWPQIAPQFTGQVFLLDQPGSVLAESVADVTRVGVLNEALRASQSDRRTLSAELKVRQTDVIRLESQEATFAGLDSVEVLIAAAEATQADIDAKTQTLSELRSLAAEYTAALAVVEELQPVIAVDVPIVDHLWEALDDWIELSDLSNRLNVVTGVLASLGSVTSIVIPSDDAIKRPQKIVQALAVLTDLQGQLQPLRSLIQDTQDLTSLQVAVMDPKPLLDQTATLTGYCLVRDQIASKQSQVIQLRQDEQTLNAKGDQFQKDVQALLDQAGSCPICGNVVGGPDDCEMVSSSGAVDGG